MDKKVLVYQSYGSFDRIRQTQFSILTLLSSLKDTDNLEIHIYTDRQQPFIDFFGEHPRLRYSPLTPHLLEQWKGPRDYTHRLKIEILRHAGSSYKGPLFYCDSDTVFKSSPMSLFRKVNERTSIMHHLSGALDQNPHPTAKKILSFVSKNHFQVHNELVGIGPSLSLWSAATLGMCQTNKPLLDYVLNLTDQLHASFKNSVVEQLAFSFFLQTRSEVLSAEPVIHHYGSNHQEFAQALKMFLSTHQNFMSCLAELPQFPMAHLIATPPKTSLLKRMLGRKTEYGI